MNKRSGGASAVVRRASQPGRDRLAAPRTMVGVVVMIAALWWLVGVVEKAPLMDVARAVLGSPWAMIGALIAYAGAFGIRSVAWTRVEPGLSREQAWAGIHVSLLGNHVLPLRLGEVLRVTSVLRRTALAPRAVIAGVVVLRLGDLVALIMVAAVATPVALTAIVGVGGSIAIGTLLSVGLAAAWWWSRRVSADGGSGAAKTPDLLVVAATVGAWLLEAMVLLAVATSAGLGISVAQAAGVTAVTVFAQVVAVTPGGFGTYEAAGTAALVALGFDAGPAFAVVLLTHGVKTVYSLVTGGVALFAPAPGYWGRWRLPRTLPIRPAAVTTDPDAPIVVFMPAHNEEAVIASVIARIPADVHGHRVEMLVIDDGSSDDTAERARGAGATVISVNLNQGLGAAVRRGLTEAATRCPVAGVYIDADGEYPPEEISEVVAPIVSGEADYVIGSRFAGMIETMRPHRRLGNLVLTRWVRWMTRRPDLTDGQSGFRAFSPAALREAEVAHDYNYAQVLTLDLLAKGFVYAEVPIRYRFRTTGRSFVSLGRYLRKVVPAVHRELNRS